MGNNLAKIFEGNWDEIRGKIKNNWGKLTNDDIDEIDGSLVALVGKLKKTYGYGADKIESQMVDFLDKAHLAPSKLREIKNEINDKAFNIKEIIQEGLHDYFSKVKNKSSNMEATVFNYIKDNPLKLAGILALSGLALSTIFGLAKRK